MKTEILLSKIAAHIGADFDSAHAGLLIDGIAPLAIAKSGQLSFFQQSKYLEQLQNTQASAVILTKEHAVLSQAVALIVKDPYLAFAKATQLFDGSPKYLPQVAKTAIVHPTVQLPQSVYLGENVVIEADCVIGEHVKIGHGCVIAERCQIGWGSELKAKVVLYHGTKLGERCLIHSGAVLGSDGFGNAQSEGKWVKIVQLGNVILGNDVEVGANTTIDRGTLGDTVIHEGVRIDNLVQIAHNVEIGEHTAIAACTGIAGSTTVGRHCMIGGAVGISGHLKIPDRTIITAMTGVSKTLLTAGVYSSAVPAQERRAWWKCLAHLNRMDGYLNRIKVLESRLAKLLPGLSHEPPAEVLDSDHDDE